MIRISCTNCQTILSIDDAFAGGVCRCQHCGTIQTVPASARGNASVSASGHSIGGSKTLYQNGEPASAGTGLDDLASVVVSSGLTSSRLTRPSRKAESTRPGLLLPVLIGSGVLVLVLIFVIIYLLTRSAPSSGGSASTSGQSSGPAAVAPVVNTPNFCGAPLTGNTVIYLLDHGAATQKFLGDLKEATLKSAASLTTDRKFQIIFWKESSADKIVAYPQNSTTYANSESIASAKNAMEDAVMNGAPEITEALQLALEQHPDEIVIATGKGFDLNSAWADNVLALRGNSNVRIDTFNLTSTAGAESGPMKRLATQTGGTYHEVTGPELRSFGQ